MHSNLRILAKGVNEMEQDTREQSGMILLEIKHVTTMAKRCRTIHTP